MDEIERRFLCGPAEASWLGGADRVQRLRQGYLTRVGPAIRVRQKDDGFLMTVKSGVGLVRQEVEWPIPADVARDLFAIAGERTVSKTRHVFGRWEVDVFDPPLDGLVVAEAELRAPDEPLPPAPPGLVLLREVTEEPFLTNRWLAGLTDVEARAFVAALESGVDAGLAWAREHAWTDTDGLGGDAEA